MARVINENILDHRPPKVISDAINLIAPKCDGVMVMVFSFLDENQLTQNILRIFFVSSYFQPGTINNFNKEKPSIELSPLYKLIMPCLVPFLRHAN